MECNIVIGIGDKMAAPLTTKELFTAVTIDQVRKTKTAVNLKDSSGDDVAIQETVEKLIGYILDKVKDTESNSCKQQVMPLMAQAMVAGLVKLLGPDEASIMLSDPIIRNSLMYMTTMSFYLLKLIQQKNIKIFTEEFAVSQEEINNIMRASKISDLTIKFASMGGDVKEFLSELIKRGTVTKEELVKMGMPIDDLPDPDPTKAN